MKKILTVLCCLLTFAATSYAQSKDDEARVLYQRAENEYNSGMYQTAYNDIQKTANLIGRIPKIEYLWTKIIWDGTMHDQYVKCEKTYRIVASHIYNLFSSISKDTYPPEKYNEMVGLKLDIDEKLKPYDDAKAKQKLQSLDLARRESRFLKDTFDVYMGKFVNNFNETNTPLFDPNRDHYRSYIDVAVENKFPHHIEYNPLTRQIYIYLVSAKAPSKKESTLYCCPDTVNVFSQLLYSNAESSRTMGTNSQFHLLTEREKLFSLPKAYYYYEKNRNLGYHTDPKILNDLNAVMRQTGFHDYFFNEVFVYSTPEGKSYIKRIDKDNWGEYDYPYQDVMHTYTYLSSAPNGTYILQDVRTKAYIMLTKTEYLSGTDRNTITTKIHEGSWIKETQFNHM